jgi:hypothetical protein
MYNKRCSGVSLQKSTCAWNGTQQASSVAHTTPRRATAAHLFRLVRQLCIHVLLHSTKQVGTDELSQYHGALVRHMHLQHTNDGMKDRLRWSRTVMTTPLHRTAPHRNAPHRTAPHRTAPHRTAPHRTAPHRTAPHLQR